MFNGFENYYLLGLNSKDEHDRNQSYEVLKAISGEDFGYDAKAWTDWFDNNDYETAFKGLINMRKQIVEENNKSKDKRDK